MISNHQDYILVRYADVLLMAAELGSPNAQQYFNKVRERAYTIDGDGTLAPEYEEEAVSLPAIMAERKREFAFEGINYYDLLRQGVEYAGQVLEDMQNGVEVLTGGGAATIEFDKNNFSPKKGMMMIDENQIRLSNGVLTQNPGWRD